MSMLWIARGERGQTLPLVALLLAVAVAVMLAIANLSTAAVEASRAASAADAAALAGVLGDRAASDAVARANSAELLSFEREGDVVEVEIERSGRRASARAGAVVTLTNG
jgi:hypothetical protein